MSTVNSEELLKLNVMDRVVAIEHGLLRSHGYAGNIVQTQAWLEGRVNESTLRQALAELGERYPIVTSWLSLDHRRKQFHWKTRSGARCDLQVTELSSGNDEAVHARCESLFSDPLDLPSMNPITFHLLRRTHGKPDVFVVQWAHALMDGKAGELVMREINALASGPSHDPRSPEMRDGFRAYLASVPWRRRIRSILALTRTRSPRRPARLTSCDGWATGTGSKRILLRVLDEERTRAVVSRARRLFGFPSVTPVLLASAFRSIRATAPDSVQSSSDLFTSVPLNLRPPDFSGPVFQNLQTYVLVRIAGAELRDRDQLARTISGQIRKGLRCGTDVGIVAATVLLSSSPAWCRWSLAKACQGHSFFFGYHGATLPGLERLCNVRIGRLVSSIPSVWTPPGLAVSANQHGGQLNLVAVYAPEAIPDTLASGFLSAMAEDLEHPSME